MAKTDFKSVDDYVATHPQDVRAVLQRVRSTIRKALPGAEEVISYQIPAYKLHGGAVHLLRRLEAALLALSRHDRLVAAFKDELAPYELSKGTIRFPLSEPVPVRLIARIAKFRAQEAAESPEGEAGWREDRRGEEAAGRRQGPARPSRRGRGLVIARVGVRCVWRTRAWLLRPARPAPV